MPDEQMVNKCEARLTMNIQDFGPDCVIFVNGERVASLNDCIVDGVCESIYKEIEFTSNNNATAVNIEIYRKWKGAERLAFSRNVDVKEGENEIEISHMGVRLSRNESTIIDKIYSTVPSSD